MAADKQRTEAFVHRGLQQDQQPNTRTIRQGQ